MSTKDRKITHRVLLNTARLANAKELKAQPFGLVVQRHLKEYRLMLQWRSGGRSQLVFIGSPLLLMVAINAVLTTVAALSVPIVVAPQVPAHLLTVLSHCPVAAECSCGKWALQASVAMTPKQIDDHWTLHVSNSLGGVL